MLSPDGEEAGVWLQWSNMGLFCVVQSNGEIVVETVRPTLSSTPVGSPDDAARLIAKLLAHRCRVCGKPAEMKCGRCLQDTTKWGGLVPVKFVTIDSDNGAFQIPAFREEDLADADW